MFKAYKRYFDFHGRAGRSEYWLFTLWSVILFAVTMTLDGLMFGRGPLYLVAFLANIVPMVSVGFRRLHDTNRTAWWSLIGILPIIGSIVLLVFAILPGTPGPNRFGPPDGERLEDLEATFS